MEPTDKGFRLSTGTEFYAHAHILGLGPGEHDDADRLRVTYGLDGSVDLDRAWTPSDPQFTPAERQEIAAYMVALWSTWAALPPEVIES